MKQYIRDKNTPTPQAIVTLTEEQLVEALQALRGIGAQAIGIEIKSTDENNEKQAVREHKPPRTYPATYVYEYKTDFYGEERVNEEDVLYEDDYLIVMDDGFEGDPDCFVMDKHTAKRHGNQASSSLQKARTGDIIFTHSCGGWITTEVKPEWNEDKLLFSNELIAVYESKGGRRVVFKDEYYEEPEEEAEERFMPAVYIRANDVASTYDPRILVEEDSISYEDDFVVIEETVSGAWIHDKRVVNNDNFRDVAKMLDRTDVEGAYTAPGGSWLESGEVYPNSKMLYKNKVVTVWETPLGARLITKN